LLGSYGKHRFRFDQPTFDLLDTFGIIGEPLRRSIDTKGNV